MDTQKLIHFDDEYLACERIWTFCTLIFIGGFFGAFTYTIRGGVFCNAQTANFVLAGMALGNKDFNLFFYYLIPMSAYLLGAIVSESLPSFVKEKFGIRWDSLFIFVEIIAVIFLGLLPESAPFQISQITINFIASMQYNTFRQSHGVPMATTFCTNHLRQVGVACSKLVRKKDVNGAKKRLRYHGIMLLMFTCGATLSTFLCNYFMGHAIFFTLIPLSVLLFTFLKEDLSSDSAQLKRKPMGH